METLKVPLLLEQIPAPLALLVPMPINYGSIPRGYDRQKNWPNEQIQERRQRLRPDFALSLFSFVALDRHVLRHDNAR